MIAFFVILLDLLDPFRVEPLDVPFMFRPIGDVFPDDLFVDFGLAGLVADLFHLGQILAVEGLGQIVETVPPSVVGPGHGSSVAGAASLVVPQLEVGPVDGVVEVGRVDDLLFDQDVANFLGGLGKFVVVETDRGTELLVKGGDEGLAVTGRADILHPCQLFPPVVGVVGDGGTQVPGEAAAYIVGDRLAGRRPHVTAGTGWSFVIILTSDPTASPEVELVLEGAVEDAVLGFFVDFLLRMVGP